MKTATNDWAWVTRAVKLALLISVVTIPSAASESVAEVGQVEGTVLAASCLVDPAADASCTADAVPLGEPIGILAPNKNFTVLLLDARVLASVCDLKSGAARLRASGTLHWNGSAMTPTRVDSLCSGGEWRQLPLPDSGTVTDPAGGGDE